MSFDQVLTKVLEIAEIPQEKRQEYVDTFHEYLYTRLVLEIREVDPQSAQKIVEANTQKADDKKLKQVIEEISHNQEVKAKIDKVADEVVSKLANDVAIYATEEQKQKVFTAISS